MKKFFIAVSLMVVMAMGGAVQASPVAMATASDNALSEACSAVPDSPACNGETQNSDRLGGIGRNIINTALFIVGVLAVAMIVFAGLRYAMSSGDKKRVEQSKQILIYSVVGLIVALMAYAIVNFVLGKF